MVYESSTLSSLLWLLFTWWGFPASGLQPLSQWERIVLKSVLFIKLKYKLRNVFSIEEQFWGVYVQKACLLTPWNTKIHFYLVQIYIVELNINGNINNITKSPCSHYTVIHTCIKADKVMTSFPMWNSERNSLYLVSVYHFIKWNIYLIKLF